MPMVETIYIAENFDGGRLTNWISLTYMKLLKENFGWQNLSKLSTFSPTKFSM